MADIKDLMNDFKDNVDYATKQQVIINKLIKEKRDLQEEISHLKELLTSLAPLIASESKVTQIIISPEEGLIDRQIEQIRGRGIQSELTLEDVKKLDLLLKNKNLIKDENKTLKGESTKIDKSNLSNAQLLQIVSKKKPDGSQ